MIKEFNDPGQKSRDLDAILDMTHTRGWQLFMEYIKEEQQRYLDKARDKRRQFNGNNIAVFMACEGVLDSVATWSDTQLNLAQKVKEEARLQRNQQ